jgi:OmcA/MtrC family decaheme c-type cytochrome
MSLRILSLILLLFFVGCSGNDGATGPAGATGTAGGPGPAGEPGPTGTGALTIESCAVCHAEGRLADVAVMHNPPTGTATATITSVTFNPDNAVVTFTFAATDTAGDPVPANILLTPSGSNLAYARFTIAKLVPGLEFPRSGGTYRTPNEWSYYGDRSHRSPSGLTFSGGVYTFTFVTGVVLNPSEAGYTHRVGIEIYGIPNGPRSVNPTFDLVPNGSAVTVTRDIVTTAACNECHDPLGYTPSFHGSRRVETRYCGLCHNANNDLAPQSGALGAPSVPIPFAKLVHGIHTGQDLLIFEGAENVGDFTEITYPAWQDIRNCTKCHKGAADSGNWRTVPSITACGSCHTDVNFTTGVGHLGGSQNNTTCGLCHNPDVLDIGVSHRTENVTPNNPDVPSGLANFKYSIDNVTVDNNVAVVTFRITKDGAPLSLSPYPPTGFTGGPSFLLAWALPQDGISAPADYNNRNSPAPPSSTTGNGAGDAPSVSLANVLAGVAGSVTLVDNATKTYRASLTAAPFPAGAKMRAVALQSYFSQTVGTTSVGRHTPSVHKKVTGDAERRTVVKSGYTNNDPVNGQPIGCLECHETIEGHGGSRVNNVQVCLFCHNPNKSSSGRTVNPATANPETVAVLGPDPLAWPEATNNFKNMIHGIHAATDRPYEFVRNRLNGIYYNWSEVTFPGDLKNCTKCHIGDTYRPEELPAGVLYNVTRTTTGNLSETRADIIAARGIVPNSTDLVDSPIAGACYYCHDSALARSHFLQNGGTIGSTRGDGIIIVDPSP